MLACYTQESTDATPIIRQNVDSFRHWLEQQPERVQQWCRANQFEAKANTYCIIPNEQGGLDAVLLGIAEDDFWAGADLSVRLPQGVYQFAEPSRAAVIAWGLGAYEFDRYKKSTTSVAQLLLPDDLRDCEAIVSAQYLVRDLINTPTEDMGPFELAEAARTVCERFDAKLTVTLGQQLLQDNFPSIYTVGRASPNEPRLIDFVWGDEAHPKVTLVGKGVCFDTGGLDLKPSNGMLNMKKDMGGAAQVLGLAQLIMASNLPIRLRVLIPAVENSVAGNAYRPGDVITSRSGKTIEVGNTDAEGRVILSDALTLASEEQPDLLIDLATLTGAARIAMGLDLPAMFCNDEDTATALLAAAEECQDPIWRMPLFAPYRDLIKGKIADISNTGSSVYGGAITAALFLEHFVASDIPWVHFDMMAFNISPRPGRPEGGEAMGLRALFAFLEAKFGKR